MTEDQALEVLYQIAKGIEFVSNQKVVHRDIKP
jgi:serine/threonine protein kinase